MTEVINDVSPAPWAGSKLLHSDTTPLTANATRTAIIQTRNVSDIGGHIYADQACTMRFYTSPDGDNYGTASELAVAAGQTIPFEYPKVYSRTVKIEVVCGATPMTAFRLYVRGGA
jgi:hypothetical protein